MALVQLVEFRADQITGTGQTIGVNKERIYAELELAARKVLRTARRELVFAHATEDAASLNTDKVTVNDRLRLPLPADFLRFLRIECENWQFPVDELTPSDSERYRAQANEYSRADSFHPVAAIVPYGTAPGYAVEPFPASAADEPVTEFFYVAETDPEDMPDTLKDAMVYYAATSVLLNERRPGEAATALASAESEMVSIQV